MAAPILSFDARGHTGWRACGKNSSGLALLVILLWNQPIDLIKSQRFIKAVKKLINNQRRAALINQSIKQMINQSIDCFPRWRVKTWETTNENDSDQWKQPSWFIPPPRPSRAKAFLESNCCDLNMWLATAYHYCHFSFFPADWRCRLMTLSPRSRLLRLLHLPMPNFASPSWRFIMSSNLTSTCACSKNGFLFLIILMATNVCSTWSNAFTTYETEHEE